MSKKYICIVISILIFICLFFIGCQNESNVSIDSLLKKVWIISDYEQESSNYRIYDSFSFRIDTIENGEILGTFVPNGVALPNVFSTRSVTYDVYEEVNRIQNLSGTVRDSTAKCKFSYVEYDGNIITGTLVFVFVDDSHIDATILFDEDGDLESSTYSFRPYNITDLNPYRIIKGYPSPVNLSSWGEVNYLAVEMIATDHVYPNLYLVDDDDNLLYDLQGMPIATRISCVATQDLNGDGLYDIKVIFTFGTMVYNEGEEPRLIIDETAINKSVQIIVFQMENGWFYSEYIAAEDKW